MRCSDTENNGRPWEWRTLGMAEPNTNLKFGILSQFLDVENRAVIEYPDIRISDGANLFGYTKENMNIRSQK